MNTSTSFFKAGSVLLLVALGMVCGCASSDQPELTESQRQDAILQDPMNYKPHVGGDNSGADMSSFDQKGFNEDIKHVLDP